MENEAAEQKTVRAPRTFGFPGAADHVTMNLHGIDDGRNVEEVSPASLVIVFWGRTPSGDGLLVRN